MKNAKEPAVPNAAEADEWRAEGDLRTLIESEKIRADADRLKKAMAAHKRMMDAMRAIKS